MPNTSRPRNIRQPSMRRRRPESGVGVATVQDADGNMEIVRVFAGSSGKRGRAAGGGRHSRVGWEGSGPDGLWHGGKAFGRHSRYKKLN